MPRPKNSERYSPQAQREQLRAICGDALAIMKKQLQSAKDRPDFQTLANFVSKTLPIIIDDNTQTESDVTMDLLIKKAIKVNMRIREANEEGLKEENSEETEEQ